MTYQRAGSQQVSRGGEESEYSWICTQSTKELMKPYSVLLIGVKQPYSVYYDTPEAWIPQECTESWIEVIKADSQCQGHRARGLRKLRPNTTHVVSKSSPKVFQPERARNEARRWEVIGISGWSHSKSHKCHSMLCQMEKLYSSLCLSFWSLIPLIHFSLIAVLKRLFRTDFF
jgi:hypothetical protein